MHDRQGALRVSALLLVGALGVHELRYLLAYGERSGAALAEHGHGYLSLVAPLVGVCLAAVVGQLIARAAGGAPTASPAGLRLRRVWPAATAALLALYASQELLEGLLSSGHPSGWEGVFGGGGILAAPLAALFGGLVALCVRVARAVERAGPLGVPITWLRIAAAPEWIQRHAPPTRSPGCVLAHHLAGRGPPAVFV
jgi:hypothetical protein